MELRTDFKDLARSSIDSALAFEWLNADIDLSKGHIGGSRAAHASLFSTFDIVKSLRRPLDLIPATLHPTK